jgi:ABC-type transport system involved in multi-copper enzyme maturation permease subunit
MTSGKSPRWAESAKHLALPCLAVAANLARETVRQRASCCFFLLLAAAAFTLPRLAAGGATLRNKLQLAVEYGMGFPVLLIAIATVLLAAGSLSRELSSRRIQTLATKPISRWQIVLGKLLGILTLDAFLLLTVAGIFAGNAILLESEGGISGEERELARERFFTSRASVGPIPPPIDPKALEDFVKARALDPPLTAGGKSREELAAEARRALRVLRIEPGGMVELVFEGVGGEKDRPSDDLLVRYQLQVSPPGGTSQVDSLWEVAGTALSAVRERTSPGAPHELKLPGSSLRAGGSAGGSAGGALRLRVRNPAAADANLTLLLDPARVEVLAVYGRFWPNVFRGLLIVLAELFLLASLALFASALFTFPTASLLGFFVYLTGLASGFLRDAFAGVASGPPRESFTEWIGQALSVLGSLLIKVLPDFASLDPLSRLAEGRAVTAGELLREGLFIVLVEAGALNLAAAWFFSRRELATAETI